MSRDDGRTRRRFLAASAAVGIATSLAGCRSDLIGERTDTPEPTADDGEFGYGSTQEFTLEEGDGRDPARDAIAKPVTFEGAAGETVRITQRSDEFDTYLVLAAPDGTVVAEDNDGAIALDSRIITTLSRSGEYTIWAGSLTGDRTGEFTLTLEQIQTDTGEISIGETREFTLDDSDGGDPVYANLAKPVTFEASVGDEVTITHRSDAFDTYLLLEAPDGSVVAQNDDIEFRENTNSRISTTLSQSGEYTIWAGSFTGEETGPFTLSLERGLTG